MDKVKDDLILLCERFIELADNLLLENKITKEEYEELTKNKKEFLYNIKGLMEMD
jgi:ribulose 1,5-bisphosphate carboxylase large subunit-like protein